MTRGRRGAAQRAQSNCGNTQPAYSSHTSRLTAARFEWPIFRQDDIAITNFGDDLASPISHLDFCVTPATFVEAVARELLHQLPHALGLRAGDRSLGTAR